nr:hypothetical protein [Actinomycetota bacterium]
MGVKATLARLAAGGPVPVFALAGEGGRVPLQSLRLRPELAFVDSPRHARVVVVAGGLTRALLGPALAVHDQVPAPRRAVWWPLGAEPSALVDALPSAVRVEPGGDVVEAVTRVYRGMVQGSEPSAPPALLDVDPAPWRGLGPYGHGGMGMTGGVPYGRPLASRAPDRDGLELDQLSLRIGPFFPAFPPGLTLDVRLQGDVIQDAGVAPNPFTRWPGDPKMAHPGGDPFWRAVREPVPVAELELARARHHLRWAAEALRLHGLAALGARVLAAGEQAAGGGLA